MISSSRIKSFKQDKPDWCGVACAQAILNYYGYKNNQRQIFDSLFRVDEGSGTFITEIARFLSEKGLNVDCYGYNMYLYDPKKSFSVSNTIPSGVDKYYQSMHHSIVNAVNNGVNYIYQRPDFNKIRLYLKRNIPVSLRVNHTALHQIRGYPFNSHDILLINYHRNMFTYIDPDDGLFYNIVESDLLFACYQANIASASAYMLAAYD